MNSQTNAFFKLLNLCVVNPIQSIYIARSVYLLTTVITEIIHFIPLSLCQVANREHITTYISKTYRYRSSSKVYTQWKREYLIPSTMQKWICWLMESGNTKKLKLRIYDNGNNNLAYIYKRISITNLHNTRSKNFHKHNRGYISEYFWWLKNVNFEKTPLEYDSIA